MHEVKKLPVPGENAALLEPGDTFPRRHIGSNAEEAAQMLETLGFADLKALIDAAVPAGIRLKRPLKIPAGQGEHATLAELREMASRNRVLRSHIGMGYSDCIVPGVVQRNILENPGWYTAYTPYQAEIAQGRLEALLNFQTMVCDLTGMEIANSSLLDEGTAAAEAMAMCHAMRKNPRGDAFFVSEGCHPQTIDVVRSRAAALGWKVVVGDETAAALDETFFAVLLQYPRTDGVIEDYEAFVTRAHAAGVLVIVAADILSLALIKPPGEFGADAAVGSTQRFGVPLGYGGPHAGYMATRDAFKRNMPGRLVGVSHDAQGNPAYRLALQTREQHIRREKATSNICTAQVLLAVMASMYAVYHGPEGIRRIAQRVHLFAVILAEGLRRLGYEVGDAPFFDTVRVELGARKADEIIALAAERGMNLRLLDAHTVCVALDETTDSLDDLFALFGGGRQPDWTTGDLAAEAEPGFGPEIARTSPILGHAVFNRHHTETEMLRYIRRLEAKDLSLTTSMIPLGSCTMKLNATAEMVPVTWSEFGKIHPFAPRDQARGYEALFTAARGLAGGDHRFLGRVPPAERRFAGRIRRAPRHPRLPREPRPGRAQRLPHPAVGPRHEPGQRRHGRLPRGARALRGRRRHRHGRPAGQEREA